MTDPSGYYDKEKVVEVVSKGCHRDIIGGMWDEIGLHQFKFLLSRGLERGHRFLDIGCGCLRGGVHFVKYLDTGNYFGIEMNDVLLKAGFDEIEVAGLSNRLPKENLLCNEDFDFSKLQTNEIDCALALSVFTHLPLNHLRVCLERLSPVMKAGGKFYATFFEIPETHPSWRTFAHSPGEVITYGHKDPYHYRVSDMEYVTSNLPWKFTHIGDFSHPRDQRMAIFERLA